MKISQKGLYALQAMMMLARQHHQGAIKIRDIAYEEVLPEKFLELILLELKNARMVESVRGAKGGYQLRRDPPTFDLSEIIRLIDGPLAPFGDAEQLRELIDRDFRTARCTRCFSMCATRRPGFSKTHPGRLDRARPARRSAKTASVKEIQEEGSASILAHGRRRSTRVNKRSVGWHFFSGAH